ncbi:MAG: O-antigen ligase family protein [Phycisphaerae bacterium]|nr:O-antigen ligase family protein [Phycisphaerae bacterium]
MENNQITKKRGTNIFFVLFVCILSIRLSFAENFAIESFSIEGVFYDNFISLCISAILLLSAVIWFCVSVLSRNRRYEYTGIEAGLFLFIIAAVISTYFASNKRAAMNDALTIIAIICGAIVLCQVLDSETKRKILLLAIIAIGIANVYQCIEQFASSNKIMIEQYEAEPEIHLQKLGIEAGSFKQMLYEHRLYSKDIRGFFTTGNSAGCFFNLAIFSAIAVFGAGFKNFRKNPLKTLVLPTAILLILFSGLLLTASKGALISFVLALSVLLIFCGFADYLKAHKKLIFFIAAVCLVGGIFLFIFYGLKHDRLPGGNSMLVRWQYWVASAAMIADHFFTGVGGGNFGTFYTQYKIPESLETVRDPHCFVLSILSSYGIIGLAGFCCGLFAPIIRTLKNHGSSQDQDKNDFAAVVKICGISAILALLFLRPLAVRTELTRDIFAAFYIFAIIYAAPAFLFGTTLWLFAKNRKSFDGFCVSTAALICGVLAVLVHNLIDFAIFEPGIMTALWAIIALIASQTINYDSAEKTTRSPFKTMAAAAIAAGLAILLLMQYIIPAGKIAVKIDAAKWLSAYGRFQQASEVLASASDDDKFNPTPPSINGITLLYSIQPDAPENQEILRQAENTLLRAIERNPADFSNYERLAEVYQSIAETQPQEHLSWSQKAFETLEHAVKLYPGSAKLHLSLASAAHRLDKIDYAIEHYSQAIAIEDAYREQFKIMYPGREVFSRLGEIKYRFAKDRLEQLTLKQDQEKNTE